MPSIWAPQIERCPVRALCAARRLGVQLERPVMPAPRARPERVYAAGVVHKAGRVLLVQRPADELLGGLWAFPAAACGPAEPFETGLARALRADWGLEVSVGARTHILHHGFTHFKLTLHVYECHWRAGRLKRGANPRRWARPTELEAYPMGKTDRQIAQALLRPRLAI